MRVGVEREQAADVAGQLEQPARRVQALRPRVDLDRDVVGTARLEDELGGADTEAVADVQLVVEETLGGEVLAELAPPELELRPLSPPELVELGRIGVHGFFRASMDTQVGLSVPVEVQHPDRHATRSRFLEDPGRDRPAPPRHLARQADVDGEHPHRVLPACSGVLASRRAVTVPS